MSSSRVVCDYRVLCAALTYFKDTYCIGLDYFTCDAPMRHRQLLSSLDDGLDARETRRGSWVPPIYLPVAVPSHYVSSLLRRTEVLVSGRCT